MSVRITNGRFAGSPTPPRRRVASATSHSVGRTSSAVQPSAFRMWRLRTWPSSWAITTSTSPREKRPSRSVFQSDDARGRPEPDREGVRLVRPRRDVLHAHRRARPRARRARSARRRRAARVLQADAPTPRRASPTRSANSTAIPTITGHATSHQRRNRPARPTSSTIVAIAETRLRREGRPLGREPGGDVEGPEAPVMLPPQVGEAERQRDEPERDEQHHARDDRARRSGPSPMLRIDLGSRQASTTSATSVARRRSSQSSLLAARVAARPREACAVKNRCWSSPTGAATARSSARAATRTHTTRARRRLAWRPRQCASPSSQTSTPIFPHSRRSSPTIDARGPRRALVPRRHRRLRAAARTSASTLVRARATLSLCGNHDLAVLGAIDVGGLHGRRGRGGPLDARPSSASDAGGLAARRSRPRRSASASSSSTAARATRSGTTCSASRWR